MTKVLMTLILIFAYFACERFDTKTASDNFIVQSIVAPKKPNDCVTVNFHYLELKDYSYGTSMLKHIEVFLDVKAFAEENLKTLFAYLSKKYSEPETLVVVVHTDWAQLQFPSDCPGGGRSGMPDRPNRYNYHQAIYYRKEKIEYFRYNPILKVEDSEFKTVVLRNETKN